MSLMLEYIERLKKGGGPGIEAELLNLIGQYNNERGRYLFIYAAALGKRIPEVPLDQSDFYLFHDLLGKKQGIREVDVYIETPGGSGEAAEEIVKFLHNKFDSVSFLVSGEAKSAGTIMVLSGDEILMTETGSLGPIDAQMQIGRSIISAYDYTEWVDSKRKEADDKGKLNPFDATMVAQITPGELGSAINALKFAGVEKMRAEKEEQERKEAILTFLQLTREGKFAEIEESSMAYTRVKEQREDIPQEEYFYSLR